MRNQISIAAGVRGVLFLRPKRAVLQLHTETANAIRLSDPRFKIYIDRFSILIYVYFELLLLCRIVKYQHCRRHE